MTASTPAAGRLPTLEDKVRFLGLAESYPDAVTSVIARETHMSWVFLAGSKVYKLKKPVRFPYLDFTTLARREAACRAELTLNRRLAPDVYLGLAPVVLGGGGLSVGGEGAVVDWLVVMRRLDEDLTLEAAIRSGGLRPPDADRVAERLRHFYRQAGRLRLSPEWHLLAWTRAISQNRDLLRDPRFHLPPGPIETVVGIQRRFLRQRRGAILERVALRRIVDAHGDLRPEHVWLGDPVKVIDCLEFDPRLRRLDPLDEIAFLHLECERLGALWAGERIRRRLAPLLAETRDDGLFRFYRSHRALLRARLAISHLLDPQPREPAKWPPLARRYLDFALADAVRLARALRTPTARKAVRSSAAAG